MCERCGVMEKAFFAEWNDSHRFNAAFAAAIDAATEYDQNQERESLAEEDKARLELKESLADRVEEIGLSAAVTEYAESFPSQLGQEHGQLINLTYEMLDLSQSAFNEHKSDKVKTTLEVSNQMVAYSMAGISPFAMMIVFATLLVEVAACPDARAALDHARGNIPGVVI